MLPLLALNFTVSPQTPAEGETTLEAENRIIPLGAKIMPSQVKLLALMWTAESSSHRFGLPWQEEYVLFL